MIEVDTVLTPHDRADAGRVGRAVLLSAILHACLLIGWKMAPPAIRVGGSPVLSVHLGNPYQQSRAFEEGPINANDHSSPAVLLSSPKSTADSSVTDRHSSDKQPIPMPPQAKADVVSGGPQSLTPGNTNVLMVINEEGTVQDLIWQELPPLTRDKLERLELRLREKKFLATGKVYTLREVIDVQRYLQR